MSMSFSVILPFFNSAETIVMQLDALSRQAWPESSELLAVDNGSTDGTLEIVRRHAGCVPNLRVVTATERKGAAHARNVGAEAAMGDSLLFCDADDEVGDRWLAAMAGALTQYPFVACRLDAERLNPAWVRRTYGPHPQHNALQKIWYPPYLPHGGGGTLGVHRSLHAVVGGFDETLQRCQDVDYCFRIQLKGAPLTLVTEAIVHIRHRHRIAEIFRQGRDFARYNVLLYKRYLPPGTREYWRWRQYGKRCGQLFMEMPKLRTKADWSRWVWQIAWQVGRLQGSLRYGVPPA